MVVKLNRREEEAHLVSLVQSGEYSTAEVADLFGVGRSTVYRAIDASGSKHMPASRRRRRSADASAQRRRPVFATSAEAGALTAAAPSAGTV